MDPNYNYIDFENCFVHQLDESNCFVCLAEDQSRDTCNHANDFGFLDIFCTHPNRDEFSRKHLSKDHQRRPDKDIPPSNQK